MKIIQLHFYLLMWSQATEGLLNITVTLGADLLMWSQATEGLLNITVTLGAVGESCSISTIVGVDSGYVVHWRITARQGKRRNQ
ncbi:immunoglobulin iota chain [Labeo rohita]|nr:immunoglobulin iota chain [Labeo rohita]